MDYEILYADTDEKVTLVCEALDRSMDRGWPIGLDTEFYGVDLRKESTVARSKLHLLSIAVRRVSVGVSARGYWPADAAVFPRSALEHRRFRAHLENPRLIKTVHNLGVDAHTLGNEGVQLNGAINTLALARWTWPERNRGVGFTLDALGVDLLDSGKTEAFDDLFSEEVTEYTEKRRKSRGCECGAVPCRTRQSTPGHRRVVLETVERLPKTVRRAVPLQDVVPGHPLWERALTYSAQDAIMALAIYDLAQRALVKQERDVPWL